MASVKDVAERAGVSVGTVSNVLNRPEKVTDATLARVRAAIDQLGFIRNDVARQLRAGRSRMIGLVVLDVGNPFFTELARGAERRAAEDDLVILLGNSDEASSTESKYLDLFEEQRVYGVLITPAGSDLTRLRQLRERGTPMVLVDRTVEGESFVSVSVDDVAGGRMAAEHLIGQGRRRVAFVGGPLTLRQVVDRYKGASQIVGTSADSSIEIIATDSLTVDAGRSAGEQIAARAPASRPDSVFAANDLIAIGLLQALLNANVTVPGEIAIVGYDDIAFASAGGIPLSSVRQPSYQIGYTAADLLIRGSRGENEVPEEVLYQPELVVRQSSFRA